MLRANIKAGDVDLGDVVGITGGEAWAAEYSTTEMRRVIFWPLFKDSAPVGVVSSTPSFAGGTTSFDVELRAADKLPNFSGYRPG